VLVQILLKEKLHSIVLILIYIYTQRERERDIIVVVVCAVKELKSLVFFFICGFEHNDFSVYIIQLDPIKLSS
jgi:hypothetical protein